MKTIFLTGYMGSGKTTFGRALARATGLLFIDLDELIETKAGCSIKEIFKRTGEEGFRKMETELIAGFENDENLIVACGGGTPCFGDNMDIINAKGISVWLMTSHEVLFQRLTEEKFKRPLVADLDEDGLHKRIWSDLEKRIPFYRRAQIYLDANHLESLEEINQTVETFIAAHPELEFAITKPLH